ncbi:HAMP domain-containing histidine kinase [Streptomyces sp. ISL-22]|uniref:sensor histidine kinase n=1 Tax=unclassified Streptomyces TaxID=2593676 RepID=UPI001BE99216|nr:MULTISPECIES: HAMP domain-containing sensor histidine kinase [unclassified Streptomyces]MBT2422431.1 HAMP domain-containing histidine kinase [Streptomyces sp. ISL-24]MBT2436702.1 HAMP domain-containing histidine kinase [Streptomyces sp. ISL-22]
MSRRIPLRKRLLVRLLIATVLIAVCSVAATAWLAVETTTRALREEQGQVLAEDMDVLARLSGHAATHSDWTGVEKTVRALSERTGRRIALTTPERRTIADSAPSGTALPPRAAATVDPLRTDTYTERGAQRSGIDPRVVGPYRVTDKERARLDKLALIRQKCFARNGYEADVVQTPSGRPVVTDHDGPVSAGQVPEECADGLLNTPTPTEEKALAELAERSRACLDRHGLSTGVTPFVAVDVTEQRLGARYLMGKFRPGDSGSVREAESCVDAARRAQLDPYVAPVAELFLGVGDTTAVRFDMSPANKAKVVGAAGLVLAVTVAVTAVVATRLVRPLRALTAAAQQPPELHVRVPVTTRDETGILAAAFNELTERRERLEAQRKAMVSDIAHELRSPLTNIRGWLEVVRDGVVDPDPDLLAALHEEALLLQRVIDDLRDLAAADAGTLRLHREAVRCDEILAQVAAAHRVAADAAEVTLRTTVDGTPCLDADPVRMRQALGNLVSNALRHTPAGGTVTLSARRDGDDVLLEVTDTGTGIAPEDLPHVFDRFWRAEKSRSRRTGGSGLGLPIVRHLVAAHGGTARAVTEPGTGSVFTLRLPGARE